APAWRSSSRPARRCSSLRSAFQVMRLMWKIMFFSFSVVTGPPGARDQWPSAAADQLDEVALGVCEVGEPPFRGPGVWNRRTGQGRTGRREPCEGRFEIVDGEADVTQA